MNQKRTEPMSDQQVESLLSEAGPRPLPPAEHTREITSAARAEWRRVYQGAEQKAVPGSARDEIGSGATIISEAGISPSSVTPESSSDLSRATRNSDSDHLGEMRSKTRSKARSKTRSKTVWLLAAAVLAVLALGWWSARLAPVPESVVVATVIAVDGSGTTVDGRSLVLGDQVRAGETLVVAPSASTAGLRLPSGHSLRLLPGTRLALASATRLELAVGRIYLSSNAPGERDDSLQRVDVVTRAGVVTEIGTQFEVEVPQARDLSGTQTPQLLVRVREGAVEIQLAATVNDAAPVSVRAGAEVAVDQQGRFLHREISTYGDEWTWILDTAPPFELDGRTVAELLSWFARETGRQLVYSTTAVSEAAQERFEGAGSATPEVALEILRGANFEAVLEGGVVIVSERTRRNR